MADGLFKRLAKAINSPPQPSEKCPWCRQWSWAVWRVWERDPFIDHKTCETCGGTSLWRWEMCMVYIGALEPPKPAFEPYAAYDITSARLRAKE